MADAKEMGERIKKKIRSKFGGWANKYVCECEKPSRVGCAGIILSWWIQGEKYWTGCGTVSKVGV